MNPAAAAAAGYIVAFHHVLPSLLVTITFFPLKDIAINNETSKAHFSMIIEQISLKQCLSMIIKPWRVQDL